MKKFCPECGRENPENIAVCPECGENLKNPDTGGFNLLDNRYKILNIVKSGSMGCVYKAQDTRLGSIVAVKKMLSQGSKSEQHYAEKRFLEEARLLSKLHYGGLPKVSDFFITDDPETGEKAHFLVMTFIDGLDLENVMNSRNKEPIAFCYVKDYFEQVLEILYYLHSQEPPVIYRDMKPSNIILDKDRIYLVDFGIARIFQGNQIGTMIGTPGYASPEQYKGFTDQKSDLYSLGVVIHYLLTGVDPGDPENPPFQFRPIREYNGNVPENFEKLILSMLEVVPENRPQSSFEILSLLGGYHKTKSNFPKSHSVKSNLSSIASDTFLMETYVAGTSYVDNIREISYDLEENQLVLLEREPQNPYDDMAILILDEKARKIGYVPRHQNEVIARLMDVNKLVVGKIVDKQWNNSYLSVTVNLYLREIKK